MRQKGKILSFLLSLALTAGTLGGGLVSFADRGGVELRRAFGLRRAASL